MNLVIVELSVPVRKVSTKPLQANVPVVSVSIEGECRARILDYHAGRCRSRRRCSSWRRHSGVLLATLKSELDSEVVEREVGDVQTATVVVERCDHGSWHASPP